jgi:hypothetical protein
MLIEDFIKKIEQAERQVMDALVDIASEAALNTKALVVKRVQENGLGQYSERDMPSFLFFDGSEPDPNKTKSNAGIKFIKDSYKKRDNINWADIRDAEGLQTDHVDLTFTGEMFRDLNVIGVNVQAHRVTAILGCSRKETQDKLRWNVERYGNFMQPTKDETDKIVSIIHKRVDEKIISILK